MAEIKEFSYQGSLSSSKSLMNRCLIIQSFYPDFKIEGESACDDVQLLKQAIADLNINNKTEFDCGRAGTTFRFLLARLSMEFGDFTLRAEKRLLDRPHEPLYDALKKMGAKIERRSDTEIFLSANGWNSKDVVELDSRTSSQFLSALVLSAWELEEPLKLKINSSRFSFPYAEMTVDLLKEVGMEIHFDGKRLVVAVDQSLKAKKYKVELDMSSAFCLSALAVSAGKLDLDNFPRRSMQPDFSFIEILMKMGADIGYDADKGALKVRKSKNLKPIQVNLAGYPDLFPVLAVLLSRVDGESELKGLDLLPLKESDRLKNTASLLSDLGFKIESTNSSLKIYGRTNHAYPASFDFDPDQDHRMVMAAALAKYQGANLNILSPELVTKSFPEFLEIVDL